MKENNYVGNRNRIHTLMLGNSSCDYISAGVHI